MSGHWVHIRPSHGSSQPSENDEFLLNLDNVSVIKLVPPGRNGFDGRVEFTVLAPSKETTITLARLARGDYEAIIAKLRQAVPVVPLP